MVVQTHVEEPMRPIKKRKAGQKKGGSFKKRKQNQHMGMDAKVKRINPRFKKMLRKKARDYNSDDDSEEERGNHNGSEDDDEELDVSASENGEDGSLPETITKLSGGCRAFRVAFKSIMSKSVADDSPGPVLSGHSKLIAKKLDEELAEKKVKGEAKKEKKLVAEQGHVKPANYLDSHEKFLISVATKGVVKLFNAVNKAQNAQKGLNPHRTKDEKVIKKRRKEAFFSELGKTTTSSTSNKISESSKPADGEGPSWAPLRDNYMLTNSKLKDWDKMADNAVTDDHDTGNVSEDSSSDDD